MDGFDIDRDWLGSESRPDFGDIIEVKTVDGWFPAKVEGVLPQISKYKVQFTSGREELLPLKAGEYRKAGNDATARFVAILEAQDRCLYGRQHATIQTICNRLLDLEDRMPGTGVHHQSSKWWVGWRKRTNAATVQRNRGDLAACACELAQDVKDEIATKWWKQKGASWMREVKEAIDIADFVSLLIKFDNKAIRWSQAKRIHLQERNRGPKTKQSSVARKKQEEEEEDEEEEEEEDDDEEEDEEEEDEEKEDDDKDSHSEPHSSCSGGGGSLQTDSDWDSKGAGGGRGAGAGQHSGRGAGGKGRGGQEHGKRCRGQGRGSTRGNNWSSRGGRQTGTLDNAHLEAASEERKAILRSKCRAISQSIAALRSQIRAYPEGDKYMRKASEPKGDEDMSEASESEESKMEEDEGEAGKYYTHIEPPASGQTGQCKVARACQKSLPPGLPQRAEVPRRHTQEAAASPSSAAGANVDRSYQRCKGQTQGNRGNGADGPRARKYETMPGQHTRHHWIDGPLIDVAGVISQHAHAQGKLLRAKQAQNGCRLPTIRSVRRVLASTEAVKEVLAPSYDAARDSSSPPMAAKVARTLCRGPNAGGARMKEVKGALAGWISGGIGPRAARKYYSSGREKMSPGKERVTIGGKTVPKKRPKEEVLDEAHEGSPAKRSRVGEARCENDGMERKEDAQAGLRGSISPGKLRLVRADTGWTAHVVEMADAPAPESNVRAGGYRLPAAVQTEDADATDEEDSEEEDASVNRSARSWECGKVPSPHALYACTSEGPAQAQDKCTPKVAAPVFATKLLPLSLPAAKLAPRRNPAEPRSSEVPLSDCRDSGDGAHDPAMGVLKTDSLILPSFTGLADAPRFSTSDVNVTEDQPLAAHSAQASEHVDIMEIADLINADQCERREEDIAGGQMGFGLFPLSDESRACRLSSAVLGGATS